MAYLLAFLLTLTGMVMSIIHEFPQRMPIWAALASSALVVFAFVSTWLPANTARKALMHSGLLVAAAIYLLFGFKWGALLWAGIWLTDVLGDRRILRNFIVRLSITTADATPLEAGRKGVSRRY